MLLVSPRVGEGERPQEVVAIGGQVHVEQGVAAVVLVIGSEQLPRGVVQLERQQEAAAVRERYKGKTLLETSLEETARVRSENAALKEHMEKQTTAMGKQAMENAALKENMEKQAVKMAHLEALVKQLMEGKK